MENPLSCARSAVCATLGSITSHAPKMCGMHVDIWVSPLTIIAILQRTIVCVLGPYYSLLHDYYCKGIDPTYTQHAKLGAR